jgi:hypothetical protein
MARETQTDIWGEAETGWTDEVRMHPWLGVAAAFTAGALLGAVSRGERDRVVRVRVDRGEQVRIGFRLPEALEEQNEASEVEEESRIRRFARSAGEPLRRLWAEEEPEEPLERVRAALRSGVDRLAERLPGRRPRSRFEQLRDSVEGAVLRTRKRGAARRVRSIFD